MPFAETWMGLETVIHSEMSQRNKHHILTHVESRKMVLMNLFAEQKQRHRCRECMQRHQGVTGGGIRWEAGTDRYTLPYIADNSRELTVQCRASLVAQS